MTKNTTLIPEKLLLNEKSITVYDKEHLAISYSGSFSHRETVKLSELPHHTKHAFVDTEDKRFYTHNGFDCKRIVKAILNNVKSHSFKEGASTLSQQLIKNTHLSQEKTIRRKLQEWKLTRKLEKNYTKDEILERYLNTIYFGHNCFGIHAAAKFYFNKIPSELSLADSAILAGLVKSPNNYSPFKHPENCQRRKSVVLQCMRTCGHINDDEQFIAKQAPIPTPFAQHNNGYCAYVFDELTDVADKLGITLGGKIEIYTHFDSATQEYIEQSVATHENSDFSCLILDNKTGFYKAAFSTVGKINRLPGSLIKPLLVYAPALEENVISPATPILDEKINYSGYTPENYGDRYHGYVSARESVAKSLNIPAVKVLQALGVKKGCEYLEKMKLLIPEDDYSLALALGGMKNGFTLSDLVGAYALFPNNGTWESCHFISEIKINDSVIYRAKKERQRVFSEETAFLMTNMLQSAVQDGTAKKLRALPFDIAAKTGTVGTKEGNTDAYALSYTKQDTIGIWLGNTDNSIIPYSGGTLPCTMLSEINQRLYDRYKQQGISIEKFSPPKGVQKVWLDRTAYYDTHNILLADDISPVNQRFEEWFNAKSTPTKKSDFFSSPSISPPSINLENNQVVITLPKDAPKFYRYKILRYDYVTHTTLYDGEYLPQLIDSTISPNKTYVYSIIPIYENKPGKAITMPAVNPSSTPQEIPKDWWRY